MDPSERLREHVVGIPVKLKSGITIVIVPAMRTARQVLSNNTFSDDRGYGALAEKARDQLVANQRNKKNELVVDDWNLLVLLAIQSAYEITEAELVEEKWLDPEGADTGPIANAAWGLGAVSKARKRALALACAGLGDFPLAAAEAAFLADWIWNNDRAPSAVEG